VFLVAKKMWRVANYRRGKNELEANTQRHSKRSREQPVILRVAELALGHRIAFVAEVPGIAPNLVLPEPTTTTRSSADGFRANGESLFETL
jgi:hypothetical protein